MSRKTRILRNIAIALAAFVLIVLVGAVVIVQTEWFRNYVRQDIASSVAESTGGKVEIGSFAFDVRHVHATMTDFVIHGKEPRGAAPFVRIPKAEATLRLFTSLHRLYEFSYLGIEHPEANIMVLTDGTTNIPTPRQPATSQTTAIEDVVDLAVGRFELSNGLLTFNAVSQALDIRANNLNAQLTYSLLTQSYNGQLSMEPVYLLNGRNTPVNIKVTVPIKIARDRIDIPNASIATASSAIAINGSVRNMRNPEIQAQISGHLSTLDIKNAANIPISTDARRVPSVIELEANASLSNQTIHVSGLHARLGQSNLQASGTLKDTGAAAGLQFKTELALRELAALAKANVTPTGALRIDGTAMLDRNYRYSASGNLQGKDLAFSQGGRGFSGVQLNTAFHADSDNIDLKGIALHAFGGEFTGDVSLASFDRYQVAGKLGNLSISAASRAAGVSLPYNGAISGAVKVQGALSDARSTSADAKLTISPLKNGIPLSGKINVTYTSAKDDVLVQQSFLALPHSRLTLNGSLKKTLTVALTTRDLNDLLAAFPTKEPIPVTLRNGEGNFTGAVSGGLASPRITGHLAATHLLVEGRSFDSLQADLDASAARAGVANGVLSRGSMQGSFDGSIAMHTWNVTSNSPVMANASMLNGDLADLVVLAGQPAAGYSGAVTASAHITGTVGDPQGTASIEAHTGQLHGEKFNLVQVQVRLADQLVTVPAAFIDAPAGRVNLTAELRHPRDSFLTGQVNAHIQADQLNAGQLHTVQQWQPGASGTLQVKADVSGELGESAGQTTFLLRAVNGNVSARALRFEGQNYGDVNATARTSGTNVTYNVASDFANSNIQVSGTTQLIPGYPTNASGTIASLPVERMLTLAKQTGIPARGQLSGNFRVNGTMAKPEGSGEFNLAQAVIYDEPLDTARIRLTYLDQSIDVPELAITSGPSHVSLTAHYDHPAGDLMRGTARLDMTTGHIDLGRTRNIQKLRPGLAGALDLKGKATGTIRSGAPPFLLSTLDADVTSTDITANGRNFGQIKVLANTVAGSNRVHFALDSNLAGAALHGSGDAALSGDYPLNAQLGFSNVAWSRVATLIGTAANTSVDFEATTDGEVKVNGPVLKPDQVNGSLVLNHLELSTRPRTGKPLVIASQGAVQMALDKGTLRIQNAHLAGSDTDLQVSGSAAIPAGTLNLNVSGKADLGSLQKFDRELYSAGKVDFNAVVRGTTGDPLVNGQLNLQNASLNYGTAPIGIANANGTVLFNGNSAQIRNLTAEAGGGKVTVTGFAGISNGVRFGLQAKASNVRLRVQQGVSVKADADIRLTGTSQSSRATGTVTVNQLTYAPQSDIGSILTRAAPPVQAPAAPSPLLDNMQLDIRVRTASGAQFQASLAENLQAEADLRIRGTANEPGILGRITIDEGTLVFFGATYTVDTGTIAFYNPVRIEPVLDVSLETQAKGVTVTLRVTGPLDNMKLSYTSDPPLQFQEIVGLLASGKTPTSDPTLLANQPQAPQQGFQQMGESAILGQAVANPVASRLQRVFGVTQLKIDPSFTTGSDVPTARLSLQQRITNNLTFTYVSALDDPNSTTIRIEWALNPQWSAVATRDQNGIFSVNFFYKKEFR